MISVEQQLRLSALQAVVDLRDFIGETDWVAQAEAFEKFLLGET